jgi:hypothetical protein
VQKVFIFMFLVIQLYVLTWWFFSLVCSKFFCGFGICYCL